MKSVLNKKVLYFFVIPAFIVYTIFLVVPVLMSFFYSLTNWSGIGNKYIFIGLRNFRYLLQEGSLVASMKNTIIYTAFYLILGNLLGLLFAIILNTNLRLKGFYRTMFYIPTLFSSVVVGFMWSYVYVPNYGIISAFFQNIGFPQIEPNLLGNSTTALAAVAVVEVWKATGGIMIIYLAGLQTIPNELLEAGIVDGAGTWRLFLNVKLPLLATAMTTNLTFGLISGLKSFDYVFLMTNGGPGDSTSTLMLSVYRMAFGENMFGKSSALGVVSFLTIFVVSSIFVKFLRSREVQI